jgi:hypothetical protein
LLFVMMTVFLWYAWFLLVIWESIQVFFHLIKCCCFRKGHSTSFSWWREVFKRSIQLRKPSKSYLQLYTITETDCMCYLICDFMNCFQTLKKSPTVWAYYVLQFWIVSEMDTILVSKDIVVIVNWSSLRYWCILLWALQKRNT